MNNCFYLYAPSSWSVSFTLSYVPGMCRALRDPHTMWPQTVYYEVSQSVSLATLPFPRLSAVISHCC